MDTRIIAGRTGSTSRTCVLLRAVALAAGCCWVAGCAGLPWEDAPGFRFVQVTYTKLPNHENGDRFGTGVALEGDILAIGMPGDDSGATGFDGDQNDEAVPDAGAVHVFRRSGTGWQPAMYLKASNAGTRDQFGSALALDGDTLAVGAPYESSGATGVDGDQDNEDAPENGAVYVFRRSDTGWQQEAYVKAPYAKAGQHFGRILALDGDTLVVMVAIPPLVDDMPYEPGPEPPAPKPPAVYVFRRNGTSWQEEARFSFPLTWWYDWYAAAGGRIALSGDTLAISAPGDVPGGAVHVFRRSGSGTRWQEEAYLKASNAGAYNHVETALQFGVGLALEGDVLAVGAPGDDGGAVYVFRRSGTAWQQEAYVKASISGSEHSFGRQVVLDGDTLAVMSDTPEGHAHPHGIVDMFQHDGTRWQEKTRVTAATIMQGNRGGFGKIALSGDDLVIGAPGDGVRFDMNANFWDSGAIYVFQRVPD
jgi:hypothetical protein